MHIWRDRLKWKDSSINDLCITLDSLTQHSMNRLSVPQAINWSIMCSNFFISSFGSTIHLHFLLRHGGRSSNAKYRWQPFRSRLAFRFWGSEFDPIHVHSRSSCFFIEVSFISLENYFHFIASNIIDLLVSFFFFFFYSSSWELAGSFQPSMVNILIHPR